MEQYWESIRGSVCRKCIDGDGTGNCRLPRGETCALITFFPEVVSMAGRLDADTFDEYLKAIRTNVCMQCENQSLEGTCAKRDAVECALDRYYPLVINVLEDALSKTGGGVVPVAY